MPVNFCTYQTLKAKDEYNSVILTAENIKIDLLGLKLPSFRWPS